MKSKVIIATSAFMLSAAGFLLFSQNVFSQFPSFEVYCNSEISNCSGKNYTAYPTVENVQVYKSGGYVYVTAKITDVSGVYAAIANIEDPENLGSFMNVEYPDDGWGEMTDYGSSYDGSANDGIFGTVFFVDNEHWNPKFVYYIDISTTDWLGNNSMAESGGVDYRHVANFALNDLGQTVIEDFSFSPFPVPAGTSAALSAKLTTLSGTVIVGKELIFTDITNSVEIGSVTTNSSGIAEISYFIPLATSTGNISVRVSFEGDSDLQPAEDSIGVSVAGCANLSVGSDGAAICASVSSSPVAGMCASDSNGAIICANISTNSP